MKCPYCAEEIKDDAKKCRYCGEWVEKKSVVENIKNAFTSAKENVAQLKENVYGPDQFYMPTDSVPLEVEKLRLFKSYFSYDSADHQYGNITNLYFYKSILNQSLNNIPLQKHTKNVLQIVRKNLEVFNDEGRLVYTGQVINNNSQIEMDVPKGVYFLKISVAKDAVVKSLIKL